MLITNTLTLFVIFCFAFLCALLLADAKVCKNIPQQLIIRNLTCN